MTLPTALRRSISAALLGGALVAVTGCAMLSPKTPEQQVTARATQFWEARRAGDYPKAYSYATPAYRAVKTVVDYQRQFGAGVSIPAAEVSKVVCAPQKCDVQMKLSVLPFLVGVKIPPIDTYVNEIWLLEDGQWWRFQEL